MNGTLETIDGPWPQVHERYAESFGVDPDIGRRAYAEHRPT